jgi:hypothetical protein
LDEITAKTKIMGTLFDDDLVSGAIFSNNHKYRFVLWRIWTEGCTNLMVIGLNPSIADGSINDPTIRRITSFAKAERFGGFYMLNLFTLISTDPRKLLTAKEPDYLADEYLLEYRFKTDQIIFAWGNNKVAEKRAKEVIDMFPYSYCWGKNKDGSPKHPLYLPKSTKMVHF